MKRGTEKRAGREPWVEYILRKWAEWVAEKAVWQGMGGGVDTVGLLDGAGWGRIGRAPGTHSDPVLAEVMATLHDKQGPHARLHAEISGLPPTERRALVARYCGKPERMERVRDADVPPWQRSSQQRRYCLLGEGHTVWGWSGGLLPFSEIGRMLGLAPSTCHDAVERAKLRLLWRLEVGRSIRFGRFAPDGGRLREEAPDAA